MGSYSLTIPCCELLCKSAALSGAPTVPPTCATVPHPAALLVLVPTNQRRSSRLLGPVSLPVAALVAALASLVALSALHDVDETDVYWRLLVGHAFATGQGLSGGPSTTFGPFDPSWQSTQVLAEAVIYQFWNLGSWPLLAAMRAVAAVLVFFSLLITSSAFARRSVPLVAPLSAVVVIALNLNDRPLAVTYIALPVLGFLALRLLLVGHPPPVILVFAFTGLWVFFHNTALIVFPVLLLAALVRVVLVRVRLRPGPTYLPAYLAACLAALAGSFVGPLGAGIYARSMDISAAAGFFIDEWASPGRLYVILLVGTFLAFGLLYAFCRPARRILLCDAVFIAPFAFLSTTAVRMIPVAILVLAPLLMRRASQACFFLAALVSPFLPFSFSSAARRALPGVSFVMASVTVASVVLLVREIPATGPLGGDSPKAIMSGLTTLPPGARVINDYNIAGRVQLFSPAGVLTATDGRADRYGETTLRNYLAFTSGRSNWKEILALYPGATDAVLKHYSPAARNLKGLGWSLVCSNNDWVWLTKPPLAGRACLSGEPVSRIG